MRQAGNELLNPSYGFHSLGWGQRIKEERGDITSDREHPHVFVGVYIIPIATPLPVKQEPLDTTVAQRGEEVEDGIGLASTRHTEYPNMEPILFAQRKGVWSFG